LPRLLLAAPSAGREPLRQVYFGFGKHVMRTPEIRRNWKSILLRAWSVRLILTAALFSGFETALPYAKELGWLEWLPGGTFAILAFLVSFGALIARIVVQNNLGGSNAKRKTNRTKRRKSKVKK